MIEVYRIPKSSDYTVGSQITWGNFTLTKVSDETPNGDGTNTSEIWEDQDGQHWSPKLGFSLGKTEPDFFPQAT